MARILVIDDDDGMRRVVRRFLETDGHAVFEAPDGKVGLRVYRENLPDVVITDLFMPEQEGLETIRELRRASAAVRIVVITGAEPGGALDFRAHATALGAQAALSKPFTRDELRRTLRGVLDA